MCFRSRWLEAYLNAFKCDPLSAFGGVVALNYKLSSEIAKEIIKTFYEVILAPEIDDKAKKILATKKNLRVLIYNPKENVKNLSPTFMQKTFLLQDENLSLLLKDDLKIVTKVKPTDKEIDNLLFANQVCKHVKSNAIVISNNKKTLGIGGGQTSRVGSSEIACKNANKFFPNEIIGFIGCLGCFFSFC